jgi:hypothetical protein
MRIIKTALIAALVVVVAGVGTAGASHLMTGKDIRDSSLTGRDVRNGSLTPADFSGSVAGPAGARGAQGLPGAAGAAGAPGVASITTITGTSVYVSPGLVGHAEAYCPAGTAVVGTGFNASIGNVGFAEQFGTFVGVAVWNDTSIAIPINAQAICAGGPATAAARSVVRPDTTEYDKAVAALRAAH